MLRRLLPPRIATKIRELLDSWMDHAHATRHPTGVEGEVIASLSGVVSLMTPNDKWSLGGHIPQWLKALDLPPELPLPPSKQVFVFCAYRGQFTMELALAVLLAWRGHKVTIGYLPKLQSPIKPPLSDGSSAKPYLASVMAKVEGLSRGRIKCVDLSDVATDGIEVSAVEVASKVRSDVVMNLRRETLDMHTTAVAELWGYYERQAINARRIAKAYLVEHRDAFDVCLIPNGTTFEGAQFFAAARELGIPANCYEKFAFRNVRVLMHNSDFSGFGDLQAAWDRRAELGYLRPPFLRAATAKAMRLLNERRAASRATWAWALQGVQQNAEESLAAAGVTAGEPFILICPNVPYDAGYDSLLGTFDSMGEWLRETVRTLLEESSIRVVVRAHPGEGAYWGSNETSAETLREFIGHERLTFIDHDRKVNTYGLMEACKFGVVFSSTTGLEMAMLGRRVLVASPVYYSGKGFTTDGGARSDYVRTLVSMANEPVLPELSAAAQSDAQLFHFILHYVMQWPYPYDKISGVRRTPPRKLLQSGATQFLPYLDALVLSGDEWQQRMPDFIGAGRAHVNAGD